MKRIENARMENWLKQLGINCNAKFLWNGSLKGCWRLDDYKMDKNNPDGIVWWGNKELQAKLTGLGFVDYDKKPLSDYSGNGGRFSVFVRLTNNYTQIQLLYGTDDRSAIY